MKDFYKINEISKLYGIGVDSLRYYEKLGILSPERGENGYRLYSLKEIYILNIIRDLRRLDFSLKQIKDYLEDQCIANTLALMQEEQVLIQQQMEALQATREAIHSRMDVLSHLSAEVEGRFIVKSFPNRFCLRLTAEITRDEETDFAINKLHRKHENMIHELGNLSIGAVPSMDDFNRGVYGVFNSVFFILEQETDNYDFVIPAGRYLSVFYRGKYEQSPDLIREILQYAKDCGLEVIGDPFELYHIDNRYTMRLEEFLTELQIRVSASVKVIQMGR